MISSSMATSLNPICFCCKATDSILWFKDKQDNVLCKSCFKAETEPVVKVENKINNDDTLHCLDFEKGEKVEILDNGTVSIKNAKINSKEKPLNGLSELTTSDTHAAIDVSIRKSSRNKSRVKHSSYQSKQGSSKGKGRRSIFKKCVR
jgi:hypothetical protein